VLISPGLCLVPGTQQVAELKEELQRRGAKTSGTKKELTDRLEE
jgi:hypothetical protein